MTEEQPREMELIERLREAPPKLAVSRAAKLARLHESRWRQLAKGYQQVTAGTRAPAKAPAETLARMARAVGATPDQLREVGRSDAATALESLPEDDAELHDLEMAIMEAIAKLQAVFNLALGRKDTRALTTSADAIASVSKLLVDDESSDDAEVSGLSAAARRAAKRVGPEQAQQGGNEGG